VPSRMRKAIAVREFLEARKDVFVGTRSAARAAIVVSDPASPTFGGPGVQGAHKALCALHRSPDLMDESRLAADMPYDLVVLPEQAHLGPEQVAVLERYLARGGRLLSAGAATRAPAVARLLGIEELRPAASRDGHVLLKTADEPTGVDAEWDGVRLAGDARQLYPLYCSWDQFNTRLGKLPNNWPMHGQVDEVRPEPAGIPAAVVRQVGRGRAVHLCTSIFSQYAKLGDPQMLRWLREIVDLLDPTPTLTTDAPSWVDVSLRRKGERWLVHLVNQNPGRDVAKLGSDDTWVDEIPTVGPITCRLRLPGEAHAVKVVPGDEAVPWRCEGGVCEMRLERLRIHACLVIE
jgi:hypothetical protein